MSLLYHLLRQMASSDFIFPSVSDLRRASRRKRGNQRYQTRNAVTNRFDCLLCILLIYLSCFTKLYWIFFDITLYWRSRRPTTRTQTPFVTGRGRSPWHSFLIHATQRLCMSMPVCSVDLAASPSWLMSTPFSNLPWPCRSLPSKVWAPLICTPNNIDDITITWYHKFYDIIYDLTCDFLVSPPPSPPLVMSDGK